MNIYKVLWKKVFTRFNNINYTNINCNFIDGFIYRKVNIQYSIIYLFN